MSECNCNTNKNGCLDWLDTFESDESGEQKIPTNIPCPPPPPRRYIIDPINVFNAKGRLIGYSWHYNDTVSLKIYLDESVLSIYSEYAAEFEMFLSGKKFEFDFIDIRGNVDYTLIASDTAVVLEKPYRVELPLNTDESNTIAKNTYTLEVFLIDEDNDSRINIFKEPYKIYVS